MLFNALIKSEKDTNTMTIKNKSQNMTHITVSIPVKLKVHMKGDKITSILN